MKTMKEIVSKVAKEEGGKHQASVGDVREIMRILSLEMAKDSRVIEVMLKNGNRLLKRKAN